jgi:transcriptional regulator with XRE-family HTH domain
MPPYTLADWLRDRLRERGLSQQQLAAQTGIATGTISTTLHGHIPSPSLIVTLARFFSKDAGTMLELASLLQLADLPDELPAEVKNMLRWLYRLSTRERSFIMQQVAQLLDLFEEQLGYPSVLPPAAQIALER